MEDTVSSSASATPHGALLDELLPLRRCHLEDAQMRLLAFACEEHTNGSAGQDPTVGCAGTPTG